MTRSANVTFMLIPRSMFPTMVTGQRRIATIGSSGSSQERSAKRRRQLPAGRPVEQLDRMDDGQLRRCAELGHAADIAGGDDVRPHALDVSDFTIAQACRQRGLQDVVGPRRATAEMAFR